MTSTDSVNNEIIRWGVEYLSSHGYSLKSKQPEIIEKTPWSCVVRFATSDGYIYLKHIPKLLALEANIIQVLREQFHAPVPKVIANNNELNCFLMKDAGRSLREILKQKFNELLLSKMINQFTLLQIVVADRVDVLLNIGVPDWRLDKLPDLYKQLLLQKDILIEDGLSEIEWDKLQTLHPMVSDLCEKLSSYSIKQSLVQPDFNDKNTLINDSSKEITAIDLGEITISHPFFSLISCLHALKKYHGITEESEIYLRMKDECLKNYMNVESKKNVFDSFEMANTLIHVYGALCSYRLMIACDKSKFTGSYQRQGRPGLALKEFITTYIATGKT